MEGARDRSISYYNGHGYAATTLSHKITGAGTNAFVKPNSAAEERETRKKTAPRCIPIAYQ